MEHASVMERAECLRRLSESSVGRVAFTARALPAIRSLRYALVGDDVVLRTRSGRLAARLDGQVVAFAVDEVRTGSQLGWSVVVTGLAQRLHELTAATAPPGEEVADTEDGRDLVRIPTGMVTGRRAAVVRPERERAAPATSAESLHSRTESG
jgi:hypothetical protein